MSQGANEPGGETAKGRKIQTSQNRRTGKTLNAAYYDGLITLSGTAKKIITTFVMIPDIKQTLPDTVLHIPATLSGQLLMHTILDTDEI